MTDWGPPMAVRVRLALDPQPDRAFRLPGAEPGTRSLLYRFGDTTLGASAVTDDGAELAPGSSHESVRLTFWAGNEARKVVHVGATFVVWYGGDVGHGEVVAEAT